MDMKIIRRKSEDKASLSVPHMSGSDARALLGIENSKAKAPASSKGPKCPKGQKAPKAEKSQEMAEGEALFFKLQGLIEESEELRASGSEDKDLQKSLDRKIQRIGKEARALMPDADCDAMFCRAKETQRALDSDSASSHWSAAFITGWIQKTNQKTGSAPKGYRLVVDIPASPNGDREAVHHEQTYPTSVAAEWAAVRWMTVKSDIGHLVVCRIETLDLETPREKGQKPAAIESLSYVLTYVRARELMGHVERRLKRPPVILEKKTKGGPFGVKVKNYVATFSGG